MILKWFCFILVCLDTLSYIIEKASKLNNIWSLVGLCAGIACRVYVLYGACAYWVMC